MPGDWLAVNHIPTHPPKNRWKKMPKHGANNQGKKNGKKGGGEVYKKTGVNRNHQKG
jgi:hypothetical protein